MRLLISLTIFAYIFLRLMAFSNVWLPLKLASGLLILTICMKYPIYIKIGKSFIKPDLPQYLLVSFEVLFSGIIILFFLLLIKDCLEIILWITRLAGSSWHLPFTDNLRNIGITITALFLGAFGVWQSFQVPSVKTVEVYKADLSKDLEGFSIIQLSDLHIGPFLKKKWVKKVVNKTNSTKPDLIVLTGDVVDGLTRDIKNNVAPLKELKAAHGVFGVTGNHEFYFRAKEWTSFFESIGIEILENEHRILKINSSEFAFAGLPDTHSACYGGPPPDLNKALKGAPDSVFKLLLFHRPNRIKYDSKVDLQLSGHTHGGNLFFMKSLLASFNGGFVKGLYNVNGKQLYVNPGTGIWSGFSCRIGVPSEITRIVLRSKRNAF